LTNRTAELIQHVAPKNGSSLVLIGWSDVKSCYFDLRPTNKAGNGSNSNYLSIIPTARASPILVGLNQNTTTNPTEPTNTVTITPEPSEDSSSGLSSGAKIGIGVGVALGVVVIALALGAYLLRRREQKKTGSGRQLLHVDNECTKCDMGMGHDEQFVQMQQMASELQAKTPVRQTRHELPGETAFEMDRGDRTVGELSSESEVGRTHGIGRHSGINNPGNTG